MKISTSLQFGALNILPHQIKPKNRNILNFHPHSDRHFLRITRLASPLL
jgi:hypothetical protein